ncbi:hypothetical protein ACVWZ4_006122 [Bradyrhizobium sp. USDA 4472]
MREVRQVQVQIVAPCNAADPGAVTLGYYVVEKGILTMTDGDGTPVRPGMSGELVTHRLQPGEVAAEVAKRLTRRVRLMVRGDDRGGFNRPLAYPKVRVA